MLTRTSESKSNPRHCRSRLILPALVTTATLLLATKTFGQTLPGLASTLAIPLQVEQEGLRRQEDRTRQLQQQLQPKADVLQRPIPTVTATDLPDESPCFVITEVAFTGHSAWRFVWPCMPILFLAVGSLAPGSQVHQVVTGCNRRQRNSCPCRL